jgi:phosphate starvation-inducible PhoH-like protein
MPEATLSIAGSQSILALFGPRDQHLRRIRSELGVTITLVGDQLRIEGLSEAVSQATNMIERLKALAEHQEAIDAEQVSQLLALVKTGRPVSEAPHIEVFQTKRRIQPQTQGQIRYVSAIRSHELTFCIGPAGTGKTYLAVALAVEALRKEAIRKIVLVRPAVEAGEKLGFLPGDLQAKINPYLRPLMDALGEMMDFDQVKRFTEQELIEMIPLAYMRGRTLNESFIILDEAQNTTAAQMKMFLTRMGHGSKIVVAGDVSQVDLPPTLACGLTDALDRLRGIPGICEVRLSGGDVVRHRLVQEIVRAYDRPRPRRDQDHDRA